MKIDENTNLRVIFQKNFPAQALALESASSESEVNQLYELFLKEAWDRIDRLHEEAGLAKNYTRTSDDPNGISSAQLLPPFTYQAMEASGSSVKSLVMQQLSTMLNVSALSEKDNTTAINLTLEMWGGLAGSIGLGMALNVVKQMTQLGSMTFTVSARAVAGIGVAMVGAVAAAIALSVFIPILYFVLKPAQCVLMLINNTNNIINLKNENIYSDHGKVITTCSDIQRFLPYDEGTKSTFAGFYNSIKRTGALRGVTTGYQFDMIDLHNKSIESFALGVSCPLTGKNKLSCGFNQSSEGVLESLTYTGLSVTDKIKGFSLKSSLNSTGGGTAYFIATLNEA
jgi:hypothetical protein